MATASSTPLAGENAIGGLGGGPDATAAWATVHAKVPDVEAALARAEKPGGGRVYGPTRVNEGMRTGALRDPAGNVFGVYERST